MAESIGGLGGHICIIVPAFRFLYGSLDTLGGLVCRYCRKDIIELIKDMPRVELITSYYFNFIEGVFDS